MFLNKKINIELFYLLILTLISWLPMKGTLQILGYLTLPISLLFLIIFSNKLHFSLKTLLFYILFSLLIFCSIFFNTQNLPNALFFIFTFSPWLLMGIRFSENLSEEKLKMFFKWIAWITLFESFLGLYQLAESYYQAGKVFQLSIGDDIFGSLLTYSPIYFFKMTLQSMLLLLVALRTKSNRLFYFVTGLFGLIMGFSVCSLSSIGVFIFCLFFYLSIKLMLLLLSQPIEKIIKNIFTAIFTISLTFYALNKTQGTNLHHLADFASQILNMKIESSYRMNKVRSYYTLFDNIFFEDPPKIITGVGPGNFGSRSSFILAGNYLSENPTWLPQYQSDEYKKYIHRMWNKELSEKYEGSILAMPSSSLFGILSDLGVMFFILMLGALFLFFRQLYQQKMIYHDFIYKGTIIELTIFASSFILLLSLLDFWLEFHAVVNFLAVLVIISLSSSTKLPQQ